MKKNIFCLIAVALMLATACEDDNDREKGVVPVTGVTLDQAELALAPGVSKILTAVVAPADATDKTVTWSSSDAAISVDSATGELTAETAGSAVVTVTTADGGFTATRTVTVRNVPVTGVAVDQTELTLAPGAKKTLAATVLSVAATNKSVTWSSDREAVATVNSATGEVQAIAVGEAVITATTVENGFTAACTVTVELVNLLVNPGFEEEGTTFAGLQGWTVVPAAWFTAYYPGNAGTAPDAATIRTNRIGLFTSTGGNEAFFRSGNGVFFAPTLVGNFACRIEGNQTGGFYQLVTVTPGAKYALSVDVGYRKNNNTMTIKSDETVKILSPDGLVTYHAEPVVTDPAATENVVRVTGEVTIPDGVTQVRFQLDQRTFSSPNGAPLMLADNCEFTQMPE
ncbi:MAG: Ig-like domain-containing protein [Bacteroidales bacterium]|jgi:hypothetical protein|nr:Ig-like domain-containing protein [Bacteroidales bacterium]